MTLSISKRPAGGDQRVIEDIIADYDEVCAYINGANTGLDNLEINLVQNVGANGISSNGHGKSIIDTAQSTGSTSYVKLTTPDLVTVTLPTDGLLFISFKALWQGTNGASNMNAAIFLNDVQLKVGGNTGGAPVVQEATLTNGGVNKVALTNLVTNLRGLVSGAAQSNGSDCSDVTTGEAITTGPDGGPYCVVFAAAGTYAVDIRYKAPAGSDTCRVQNRRLKVWTMGF